ncbi:NAD(+) diphosphatase [Flavimobilis sp. GY10621]|uniref:NAD(+) diphosphatase n=1 Tax=Flavimobilis rhizosphaerae TaxID=2775421 RepID=A0ABR9DMJ0_9MICO|nr:NAD(+) diphosphatase [Flavimobilis rhizosphaerae]MBD9698345.1 NAD(+) diphosphatase [Flavimobilis rhizosphaerae]
MPTDWSSLPLSRTGTDRAAARRDSPDNLARLLAAATTRVLLVRGGELALEPGEGHRLAFVPAADVVTAAELGLVCDLGRSPRDGGTDVLALVLPTTRPAVDIEGVEAPTPAEELASGRRWGALRDVGHLLDGHDAGLATAAVALAAWHARAPRCPSCGEPTVAVSSGWARRCEDEGVDHYPRTDPAVIMAVVDADERLLLGHAAHWPERRFSTLAGFVEAGEAAEAAVRREVLEETGVVVGRVEFRATQPWPFPASLMLGFVGHAETTTVTTDDVEVTDARWFTRDGLAADVAAGRVLLPMRSSIARALIEEWFGGEIVEPA